MKNTILPSIIFDYMVSEPGFEFVIEKANFLEIFSKKIEKIRRLLEGFFETPTSRVRGVTLPT